jgi:hypothetical protein
LWLFELMSSVNTTKTGSRCCNPPGLAQKFTAGRLTEMKDRRATVTDALQSTAFRLYSSAAAAR